MKDAILEKGESWYTNMADVFLALDGAPSMYNWLITDYETLPLPNEKCGVTAGSNYCWMTGEELTEFVMQNRQMQWVWAVLSGFKRTIGLDEVLKFPLPYADGYPGFWKNPVTMQHPLAEVEVTAWDSTCTMIISRNEKMVDDFMAAYPLSRTLTEYNSPKGENEYVKWWLSDHR